MKGLIYLCLFLFLNSVLCGPKDRTIKDDLSDQEHFDKDKEHNPEYDHESFLGKEQAREFEELSPEESKTRLGELFHKVDKDGDAQVTETELIDWIKFTQNKYIWDDADKQMKQNDMNKDGQITWDEYKKSTYGFMENEDKEAMEQYKDMLARDERRFNKADVDGNKQLSREEFGAFLHPENDKNMRTIVVDETLEDIDKDKDGLISEDEYIGDLWPAESREKGEEPEWVKTEKQQFHEFRDKNKDGKMDRDEVADWILPADYDHAKSEAKHLISESDENKDGSVSKEEMVSKYDLYVGSQATDFGEALKYKHEDL